MENGVKPVTADGVDYETGYIVFIALIKYLRIMGV